MKASGADISVINNEIRQNMLDRSATACATVALSVAESPTSTEYSCLRVYWLRGSRAPVHGAGVKDNDDAGVRVRKSASVSLYRPASLVITGGATLRTAGSTRRG